MFEHFEKLHALQLKYMITVHTFRNTNVIIVMFASHLKSDKM